MKKAQNIIILFLICCCAVLCAPALAHGASKVQPPTEVEMEHSFILLGWPGGRPESITVQWKHSVTEGVSGYHIYEIITGKDGQEAYVKVGSVGADETAYTIKSIIVMDVDTIIGLRRFAVTSVMPDSEESDYSEIAESRIYFHQRLREKGADTSNISIEWDAPEFGEPDTYEIWYCEDVYFYWEYYEAYDRGSVSGKEIVYQKIQNLPESTKDYVVKGLKPDTPYVFMVLSYQDGQVLDSSDFLQVRTAVPEWTQASVVYKDTVTGETIKTETINNLKPGVPYTYQPVSSFETDNKMYTLEILKEGRLLNIEKLSADPEKNILTVYYIGEELKIGRVSMHKSARLSGKKAKLKWKKVPDANGYQVVYADNPKFKKAKKKTTAKTTLTLKKLKKGKAYYVKVRAYRLDSAGNKVYGKYSKKKKIAVR